MTSWKRDKDDPFQQMTFERERSWWEGYQEFVAITTAIMLIFGAGMFLGTITAKAPTVNVKGVLAGDRLACEAGFRSALKAYRGQVEQTMGDVAKLQADLFERVKRDHEVDFQVAKMALATCRGDDLLKDDATNGHKQQQQRPAAAAAR